MCPSIASAVIADAKARGHHAFHGHVQVGHVVGSVALSAAVLLSPVQRAHAVTPEQLLFLEVTYNRVMRIGQFSQFQLLLMCQSLKRCRWKGGPSIFYGI